MEKISLTTLYWISMVLIVEPALVNVWPSIRASLFLKYPYSESRIHRIERYYNELDRPFGIMCPFRVKLRKWMQVIGVTILAILSANQLYNFITI